MIQRQSQGLRMVTNSREGDHSKRMNLVEVRLMFVPYSRSWDLSCV